MIWVWLVCTHVIGHHSISAGPHSFFIRDTTLAVFRIHHIFPTRLPALIVICSAVFDGLHKA
jgi:hypothetical protein